MPPSTSCKRIAIVVSGGPAPGINAVIGASVIHANNCGIEVVGFQGGFKGVVEKGEEAIVPLNGDDVSRVYNTGGSLLGTARFNPLSNQQTTNLFLSHVTNQQIDGLMVIGGEGSATLSNLIHQQLPQLQITHIPKTIDNDIPLPGAEKTFGFETARSVGTQVVDTLTVDAKTCQRWYLVETMGRQAGFLTIGIHLASGATLSLIPEEFEGRLYRPEELAKRIVSTIQLRHNLGKDYGVILLSEGLLNRLDPQSSELLDDRLRDELGRITYSEIELGEVLLPSVHKLLLEAGLNDIVIKHKNVGYELRCARPLGADIEYARLLGYGAVECLRTQQGAHMITRVGETMRYLPLSSFVQEERVQGRTVDLQSDFYQLACKYMVK